MKNIILFLFCFFSLALSAQQVEDCQKFKDGLFVLKSERGTYFITRKGNRQIEKYSYKKGQIILEVEWINDCTYTLKLLKEKGKKSKTSFPKELVLTVEIIETNDNSYFQITTANSIEMEVEAEMIKVESFDNY